MLVIDGVDVYDGELDIDTDAVHDVDTVTVALTVALIDAVGEVVTLMVPVVEVVTDKVGVFDTVADSVGVALEVDDED